MARRTEFYERVSAALAARAPGGLGEVRRLGDPLGPRSLHLWMTAGLITGREAAELRALSADASLDLIRGALTGADSPSIPDWSWGPVDEDHTVPEGHGVKLAADEPLEDSWSWSDGSFNSLTPPAVAQPFGGGPRFVLGEVLATGRFFTVQPARDRKLGRDLLVHRHRADSGLSAAGFVHAVRRQARLQHPIIQPVYELALDGGAPFYSTAAVQDLRLDGLLKALSAGRSVEPLPRLLESLLDVARALTFAHRHGVVHRDVRPRHVRLGRYGEVQLGGWFRARRINEPATLGSALNMVNGGLGYLAPERLAHGLTACEAPADVWGLGALLYAILARRPPYTGRSSTEVLQKMRAGELAPPAGRSEVPRALVSLCERALVVQPALRTLKAEAFAAELEDYLEGTRAEARRLEE
ncbi:MAG: protein kinase, partial [Myxococcales bacterium]|nr:protein kinase [Myxococcales bacterium]